MAIDLLSEVLADLRADAVVTGHFSLTAPWSIRKPAVPGAPFRTCVGSPFYLAIEGSPAVLVEPGDFVLLPHGHEHVMSSALGDEPVLFDLLMEKQGIDPRFDTPLQFSAGGGGAISELYTGIVIYRERFRSPIFSVLPPLIHVRANDQAIAPWLSNTLQSFIQESMSCQPGWAVAATRLADVLFVQLLRAHLLSAADHKGWLRGLADPKVGKAMAAMHSNPRRDWSVESLGLVSGMSRSRFSARFAELVGDSPIDYLTNYRMHLASSALTDDRRTLIDIAESVGYTSEKAFARAFHRWAGMPPKRYARHALSLYEIAKTS